MGRGNLPVRRRDAARERDYQMRVVLQQSAVEESNDGTLAGVDVHNKTAVVVVLQSVQPDQDYASGIFGTTQFGLKELVAFLHVLRAWLQDGILNKALRAELQCPLPVGFVYSAEARP